MSDDARDDEHKDRDDVRDHVEQRDLLEGDARNARGKDIEHTEYDRAENGKRRLPKRENDERNGQPADSLNGLIDRRADNTVHVAHDIAQTAETRDRRARNDEGILIPRDVDADRVRRGGIFPDGAQVEPHFRISEHSSG